MPDGKATWVMQDRNNGNQRMEITGVVQSVEPLHKLAITLSAPAALRGTSQYTLTPQPDGATLLASDAPYTFDSAFARFMTPLVLWQAKKKMPSDIDRLRAILEARR